MTYAGTLSVLISSPSTSLFVLRTWSARWDVVHRLRRGDPSQFNRPDDAGAVAQARRDDVVVDRGGIAELGCLDVAGDELMNTHAHEGEKVRAVRHSTPD